MTTKTIAFFVDSELQWTKKVSVETLKTLPAHDLRDFEESMFDCGASEESIAAAKNTWNIVKDFYGIPVKWGLNFDGMAQYTVVLD